MTKRDATSFQKVIQSFIHMQCSTVSADLLMIVGDAAIIEKLTQSISIVGCSTVSTNTIIKENHFDDRDP